MPLVGAGLTKESELSQYKLPKSFVFLFSSFLCLCVCASGVCVGGCGCGRACVCERACVRAFVCMSLSFEALLLGLLLRT